MLHGFKVELKPDALELDINNMSRLNEDLIAAATISAAISLKRIADNLDVIHKRRELTNICDAIADVAKQIKGARND